MRQSSKVFPTPPEGGPSAADASPPAAAAGPPAPLAPLAPLPNRPLLAPLGTTPLGAGSLPQQRQPPIPPLPSHAPAAATAPPPSLPPPIDTSSGGSDDAREPASIADLATPVASSGGAPAAAATAPPVPAPVVHAPPPPAAAPKPDQQQQHPASPPNPAPQPPPPPPPPSSKPAPVSIAIPVSATAKSGGDGPATAASAGCRCPVPPPSPPPQGVLLDASEAKDAAEIPPEEYIPFGFVELRGRLISDHPQVFKDPGVQRQFEELCKWMSLRNTLRLALDYGDAHDKYAPLDPDKDTLAIKKAAAAEGSGGGGGGCCSGDGGVAGGGGNKVTTDSVVPNISESVLLFRKELEDILQKAEFEELPQEELDKAKNTKSLMGLAVETASDEFLEYHLYYRGIREEKIQWRRWGIFKRQINVNVYKRLAISFRLKKPVSRDDVPADHNAFGVDNTPWYKRLLCGRQAAVSASLLELRDEFMYLKLFKNVLQCDVDMLLPGAVIKFTALDYLMIWIPILVGFGFAVWKAAKGTIRFNNIKDAALSVVLILMPLTWGVRAYMAIKEKQRLHQARMNALVLMHNLNNNAGVVSQLVEAAQEQEDNEAMLAYFFLWRGAASPPPMRKLDLDRTVEAYLQAKLDEVGCRMRMDFEVTDSIAKLERMGLLRRLLGGGGGGGEKGDGEMLQAVPLEEALQLAHVRHFDEAKETGHFLAPRSKAKRRGAAGMAWHECMDIFRPTGQAFRYWWNAETGQSTYYEPDEPYVKLSAAAAQEFSLEHGYVPQGPSGKPGSNHAKTS